MVIFPIQTQNGQKKLFMTEKHTTVNNEKVGGFVKTLLESEPHTAPIPSISKETKAICNLASSAKDQKLIKYAVCQSSNISTETAKKTYGISDLKSLKNNVEDAIEQALEIRKAVHLLSNVKEACTQEQLCLYIDSNTDSDETESTEDETSESDHKCSLMSSKVQAITSFQTILKVQTA